MNVVYKLATTQRLGTTVAVLDPDLQFEMNSNATYLIRGQAFFRGSTPGDVKVGFSSGAATLTYATAMSNVFSPTAAESVPQGNTAAGAWRATLIGAGSTRGIVCTTGAYWTPFRFVSMIRTGAAGGVFGLVWAQTTADLVTPAECLAGSILTYERLLP
jgi:hypothetical protein